MSSSEPESETPDAHASLYATQCPGCGSDLAVDIDYIGKTGVCGDCSASIVVGPIRSVGPQDRVGEFRPHSVSDLGSPSKDSLDSKSSEGKAFGRNINDADALEQGGGNFGRFRLKTKIGYGGFGDVWLAVDTQLDRRVAIKRPRFTSQDTKRHRRFLIESRAAAALRHPNIVPTLDAGEVDGQLYIASEYVKGVLLTKVNGDRPAPVQWVVKTMQQLAGAVAFAHASGIVHRDLKPDNVLIDSSGQPQLLDFGLAKRIEGDDDSDDEQAAKTVDGTVLGTPSYMSPEQASGRVSLIGPASDQYSLGVILYRLLAGETPLQGSPLVILQKVIQQPTPPLLGAAPRIPPDLAAICDKAREKDPQHRYRSCEAFAEDLRRFAAGESVIARPLSRWTKLRRWAAANRHEAVLAASCGIAGMTILVVSSIGWASAIAASVHARNAEQSVRDETVRLESLRDRLGEQVKIAELQRTAAVAARDRMTQSRQQLENENIRLTESTRAAEAAIAEVQVAMTGIESQTVEQAAIQDKLTATTSRLAVVPTKPKKTIDVMGNAFLPEFLKASQNKKIPILMPREIQDPSLLPRSTERVLNCYYRGRPIELVEQIIMTLETPSKFTVNIPSVEDLCIDVRRGSSDEAHFHFGTSDRILHKYASKLNLRTSDRTDFDNSKEMNAEFGLDWQHDWVTRGKFAIVSNADYWVLYDSPSVIVMHPRYGRGQQLKALVVNQYPSGVNNPAIDLDGSIQTGVFLIRQNSIERLDADLQPTAETSFAVPISDAEPLWSNDGNTSKIYWLVQLEIPATGRNPLKNEPYLIDFDGRRFQNISHLHIGWSNGGKFASGLNQTFIKMTGNRSRVSLEITKWSIETTP